MREQAHLNLEVDHLHNAHGHFAELDLRHVRKAAEPNREPGTGTTGTEPIQNQPNRVRIVESQTGKGSLKPNQWSGMEWTQGVSGVSE